MLHHYDKESRLNSFTSAGEESRLDINLKDIGHHLTPPRHEYGPAVRDYWLIHVVASGRGRFIKNGIETELGAEDCFIIRPMEVTTYIADENNPWEYYWVGFRGAAAKKLAEFALPENMSSAHAGKEALSSLITFYNTMSSDRNPGELEMVARLYEFLALLKKNIAPDKENKPDIVYIARRYLENNYFRNISVSRLAAELGVTRSYFTEIFTEKTGCSPYSYLTGLRIEKARALLENSDLRVSEIAYSVGFAGIERFSDMFKKYTGMSPVAYRNKREFN